jgi:hypothetical protein
MFESLSGSTWTSHRGWPCAFSAFRHGMRPSSIQIKELSPSFLRQKVTNRFGDFLPETAPSQSRLSIGR